MLVADGRSVVLGAADVARVRELVKAKYRLGWALLGVTAAWKKLLGKGSTATAEAAIKVTVNS